MNIKTIVILSFGILLICLSLDVFAQKKSHSLKGKMMYADFSRRDKPFSKNPYVIWFKGRYLMYSSVLPQKGSDSREIEITESKDLIIWKNVGNKIIP